MINLFSSEALAMHYFLMSYEDFVLEKMFLENGIENLIRDLKGDERD